MVSYESDPLDRDEWESRREKRRDNTARPEASTPSTAQHCKTSSEPQTLVPEWVQLFLWHPEGASEEDAGRAEQSGGRRTKTT